MLEVEGVVPVMADARLLLNDMCDSSSLRLPEKTDGLAVVGTTCSTHRHQWHVLGKLA